jgi:hypothetical protein
VVPFSFISPRSSCRNDPAGLTADRADEYDLYVVEKAEHHVARFALSIRSANDRRAVEDKTRIVEVNLTLSQIAFALRRIPVERTNVRKLVAGLVVGHGRGSLSR